MSLSPRHTGFQVNLLEPKPCTKTAGSPQPPVATARRLVSDLFLFILRSACLCSSLLVGHRVPLRLSHDRAYLQQGERPVDGTTSSITTTPCTRRRTTWRVWPRRR